MCICEFIFIGLAIYLGIGIVIASLIKIFLGKWYEDISFVTFLVKWPYVLGIWFGIFKE